MAATIMIVPVIRMRLLIALAFSRELPGRVVCRIYCLLLLRQNSQLWQLPSLDVDQLLDRQYGP